MKISGIKTFVVHCFRTNWVFVKVETDEGIHGRKKEKIKRRCPI